jgi:hypothetical protein
LSGPTDKQIDRQADKRAGRRAGRQPDRQPEKEASLHLMGMHLISVYFTNVYEFFFFLISQPTALATGLWPVLRYQSPVVGKGGLISRYSTKEILVQAQHHEKTQKRSFNKKVHDVP